MYTQVSRAEEVLKLLIEGCSVSTIERVTGVHHGTILKILVIVGEKCERIMAQKIRNVQVRDVELDEVWSFIGKKQKRVRPTDDPNMGDAYTFVAIERHGQTGPGHYGYFRGRIVACYRPLPVSSYQ